jgi:beta-glucanase (GH16 family)
METPSRRRFLLGGLGLAGAAVAAAPAAFPAAVTAARAGPSPARRRRRPPSPPSPSPTPMSGYGFADEFDGPAGSAPDPSKWAYDLGSNVGMEGELQTYTSSRANSYLDGQGHLVIAATRSGGSYASARLKTQGRFSQLGGHFAASIKLNSRQGCWPAFWLLGQDFPQAGWPACGEIDLMEDYGGSWTDSTVHAPGIGNSDLAVEGVLASDADWHAYQLDWAATTMTFSRDGRPYLTVSKSQFPAGAWVFGPGTPNNGGCFIILNLAIGAGLGPPPASVQFPVTMLVDYVRAWT